jgi:general secretion pathway protein D
LVKANWRRWAGVALVAALAAGCATGRAYVNGQNAAKAGDWDAAVAYYREAYNRDRSRVDIRLALERATRIASQNHVARARQLEEQDQLPGAAAEYRLAADLDTSNSLAAAKSVELDRRIRQRIEESRPKSRMEEMREQSRQTSPLPQLAVDPRVPLPVLAFTQSSVRDVIGAIAMAVGINVTYDSASSPDQFLGRSISINATGLTLQDALNQVLSSNGLFYKVVDPKTIIVATDNTATRGRLEDQVVQIFYLSHADAQEVATSITTMTNQISTLGVRPVVQPNKTANSIMARASIAVMAVIERLIRANDKPRAEVVIDVEILEVDRTRAASYGLNLSNYALGFTFSPEVAPPNTSATFPGAPPPPFNLNTISQGVSMADFYMSVPTSQIRLLESDSSTRILARPQLRGTEGKAVTLNLGDQIPVPTTTFSPVAAGGIATTPTTAFNLRDVGVNVTMTPKVTYDGEVVIDLSVENSAKGPDVNVAGSALPSFTSRKVTTTLRLRDGESNLLAGLLREEDKKSIQGLPGISKIPVLRALFGGSDKSVSTSDIVMIITPRIVRGHDLTTEDLKPIYVGTAMNFGLTGPPPLIAEPPTMDLGAAAATSTTPPAGQPTQGTPTSPVPNAPQATNQPLTPPAGASRNPVVVPVVPVTNTPAPATPAPNLPPPPGAAPQFLLAVPGEMQVGGGPYTLPMQLANATNLGSLNVTITYNRNVLRARTVTEGPFLRSGGIATVFTPRIDEATGRIDIGIGRPAGTPGVSGTGLIGSIVFEVIAAGPANITITPIGLGPNGQPITVQAAPVSLVVK